MGTSPGLGPGPQGIARSSRVTPTQWVVSSMVEQEAVNFEVIGSSPILPAKYLY